MVEGQVPGFRIALILNEVLYFDMVCTATTGGRVPQLRYPNLVPWARCSMNEFIWA
jgi:hypothetical protein